MTENPTSQPRRSAKGREPLPVIGWREWLGLPDLGIESIKAKVDTGARTSSLHAFDVEETLVDGVVHVRFTIHPAQRRTGPSVLAELPLVAMRRVRDSGGKTELRPVVETTVRLFDQEWPIEITLTRRDTMGFRMLLGRQAIRGRFLVDAGRSFRSRKRNQDKGPAFNLGTDPG